MKCNFELNGNNKRDIPVTYEWPHNSYTKEPLSNSRNRVKFNKAGNIIKGLLTLIFLWPFMIIGLIWGCFISGISVFLKTCRHGKGILVSIGLALLTVGILFMFDPGAAEETVTANFAFFFIVFAWLHLMLKFINKETKNSLDDDYMHFFMHSSLWANVMSMFNTSVKRFKGEDVLIVSKSLTYKPYNYYGYGEYFTKEEKYTIPKTHKNCM